MSTEGAAAQMPLVAGKRIEPGGRAHRVLAAASGVATGAVVSALVFPFTDADAAPLDTWPQVGSGVTVAVVVAVAVWVAGTWTVVPGYSKPAATYMRRALLLAAAAPVAALAAAVVMAPAHRDQSRLLDTYGAYTHRFPPGMLHDRRIDDRPGLYGNYGVVCARAGAGSQFHYREFCAGIDLDRPVGHRVIGGYWMADGDILRTSRCYGRLSDLCGP